MTLLSTAFTSIKKPGLLLSLGLFSACQQGPLTLLDATNSQPGQNLNTPASNIAGRSALTTNVKGEKVGNGPVRISMLLPLSASGGGGQVGRQMANAAKLAVRDFGAGKLQLVIKDTRGQASAASLAATQANTEGSSLVLGPLFSANVSAASGVTQPAKIPMIGFSSDVARASKNVYLLSFAPDADIRRTLTYGLSVGADRVIALLPNTAYGPLAEMELRRTFDRGSGQVVSVVRYARDTNSMITASRSIALSLPNANAIYIPDGGEAPTIMLNGLSKAGVDLRGKIILGSGQWESVNKGDPVLEGAIYAGPDKQSFERFAARYQASYGSRPSTTAGLGYDAVSMAAELIKRDRVNPFSAEAIQTRAGFIGATGIFRFEPSGRLQRGLVVNRIRGGKPTIDSPSPTNFSRNRRS